MNDFVKRLELFADKRGLKLSIGLTLEDTLDDLIKDTYTFCKLSSLYKLRNIIRFYIKDGEFKNNIYNKIDTKMKEKAYDETINGKVEYHENNNLDWSLILKRSTRKFDLSAV